MLGLWVLLGNMALLVSAQDPSRNETIWTSVIYSFHGDRTPLLSPGRSLLTPLGAQQLYSAGSFFRQRYLKPTHGGDQGGPAIKNISTDTIDNTEIYIMSTMEQYIGASSMAFMQGLYPPANISSGGTPGLAAPLANGSIITAPLEGYQYPQIYTASHLDPNSIAIDGQSNCPLWGESVSEFVMSEKAKQTKSRSQEFYDSLRSNILNATFPERLVNFDYAYLIFDYLSYGYIHDQNINEKLSKEDLARARHLADQQIRECNGYSTRKGPISERSIQTVAGQSLASLIVGLLLNNLESRGVEAKLSLLFGSLEPIVAFSILTGLADINEDLSHLPNPGSSMVFEMYSITDNDRGAYPNLNDLYVRFLFRNGSDSSSRLSIYPLFGGDDDGKLSWKDFFRNMQRVSVLSIEDWCSMCQSDLPFCTTHLEEPRAAKSVMKPAVAGVIGATVALAVAGIIFALLMLVGGFRLHHVRAKRRSDLGVFKGGKKLSPDQDVPDQRSGLGTTIIRENDDRVNSWELQGQSKQNDTPDEGLTEPHLSRQSSFATEGLGSYASIEPTKPAERV
jgi:hypothetical protein